MALNPVINSFVTIITSAVNVILLFKWNETKVFEIAAYWRFLQWNSRNALKLIYV